MKTLTTIVFLVMVLTASAEKEAIVPEIGSRFGEVVRVEAEFIEKPNTYHHQNIVKEPFLISVIAVNGQALTKPIEMEYSADTKSAIFKKGTRYQLEAYETIYIEGRPRGWDELVSQVDYHIIHRIVIRPSKQRGGEQNVGGDRVNPPPQQK